VAYLRKGETYADLAGGFAVGTTTVYRYLREALDLLAAMAPTLAQAVEIARGKAFVILDGTLLRIDRVGMGSGRDRPFCSGKHKCLRVGVRLPPTRWLGSWPLVIWLYKRLLPSGWRCLCCADHRWSGPTGVS
jgi:hypothetical protein